MEKIEKNWKAILLVIATILVVGFAYNFYVVVPKQLKEDRQDRELSAKIEYESCVNIAFKNYSDDWDLNCEVYGKEKDCSLDLGLGTELRDEKERTEKACLEVFKAMK